jgi:hypothetical protein
MEIKSCNLMNMPGLCTYNVSCPREKPSVADISADLQELRHLTKQLLEALFRSTHALPYSIRLLAREALLALRVSFLFGLDLESELMSV